ncbi:amino acid adenylation domain-containing protein [Desulfobulbus rhabdoformis]|uniref:non-ribosomal peptide synthetase/type I polyketide synthase n=1 Tax=Desulfobulbus rhabdoformis TaxID=34032 RepID=UPI001962DEDB|nr:non-ribosomal peptide synthetase/type I polyketide synthase [Desulfobulbus rhabdoformis]MBM9616235.1 amino acid adenylation domain-containing protein [Desulfobulbus rhabdoformis]
MGKNWDFCFGADLLPSSGQTLRDIFLHVAQGKGTFIRIDANEDEYLVSYSALKNRAARIAGQLTASSVRPGDAVILLMEDPLAFACGFWACILGGFVAVPLPPMETPAQRERTIGAIEVLQGPWVLSDTPLVEDSDIESLISGSWTLAGPDFDRIATLPEAPDPSPPCCPDDNVIIQFSSGSTGRPKGVQLRHAEVLANMVALADRLVLTPKDTFVSWLPLSHDFGLFHFHILPMVTGIDQVLMAATTFARKPVSWIRAMDKHKATISGAPDFALRLVSTLMKPKRAAQFDLSSVRQISNGAEPISARTTADFLAAMRPTQLNPLALKPAYGLAEATLVVTMAIPDADLRVVYIDRTHLAIGDKTIHLAEDDPRAISLMTLGLPLKGIEVRIADEDGNILGENLIGRIQVRSPAVMKGYMNNPQATQEALLAENWLDTGDIGFMDQGELVTNCRAKDLIIVQGVNYYPLDIELAAESTPGLNWTNTLAITQARRPDGNGEAVLVFVRYRGSDEDFAKIAWKIEETILEKTGLAIDYCIAVRNIPKTTSGKIQRFELGNRFTGGEFAPQIAKTRQLLVDKGEPLTAAMRLGNTGLAARLIANEAESLTNTSITLHDALMEQGVSSLHAVALCQRLATMTGRPLSIADIFDHPTAYDLAAFFVSSRQEHAEQMMETGTETGKEIAVIGYGCRFPGGANDPERFWMLLESGKDDLTIPIPANRWSQDTDSQDEVPGHAAFLDDIDTFDHEFFGIPPAEAATLDPRQRLLLDVLWQSLEHAGLDPEQLRGRRVGLFLGLSETGLPIGDTRFIPDKAAARTYGVTSAATSIAAGRLSHIFDFRGPAVAIDTACSSSLVATSLAIRAIRSGECELAIAGGANLLLSPDLHTGLAHMGALAADGRCKTFSADADGYGRGEGAGMIVLKGYEQAKAEGDSIHGILLGCAQNHDGASQNITAPNGQAQRQLLRRALLDADIGSRDVDWIETHGTGTSLGDPIEVAALIDVFPRRGTDLLPLGAVKSRIGHLEAAAGVAGVIKALLALAHERIPRNSSYQAPNPNIRWADIGARPVDEPLDWTARRGHRRIVGVSAFGMSGTNAHLLIGEDSQPVVQPTGQENHLPILAIGARSAAALEQLQATWVDTLTRKKPVQWNALLAGACSRRGGHEYRLALALNPASKENALERLRTARVSQALRKPTVLFAFTGQGAQSPGMLHQLYNEQSGFRAAFDEATALAGPIAGRLLSDWLYGENRANQQRLDQTDLAQPALVATAWGLVRLLADWGVRPDGVIGHSSGEITAALVAGALDLETAMRLAVLRGDVMQNLAPVGSMVAVSATAEVVSPLLNGLLKTVISGFNGPESITVSGPGTEIEELCNRCQKEGLKTRLLKVSRPFHGPCMQKAAEKLAEESTALPTGPLGLSMFSTWTGAALRPDALMDSAYWQEQMLSPVRFSQAATAAGQAGFNLMIEIGPRPLLSRLGPASVAEARWVASYDPEDGEGLAPLAAGLARIWQAGGKVDWQQYYGHRGVGGDRLPRHPFFPQPIPRAPWSNSQAPRPTERQATTASSPPTLLRSQEEILESIVKPLFTKISGRRADEIDANQSFLAHGVDSLIIVQLKHAVKTETGLDIPVGEFYDGTETPLRLAALIRKNLPEEHAPVEPSPAATGSTFAAGEASIPELMQAQLQTVQDIINRQLDTLSARGMMPAAPGEVSASASPKPIKKSAGGEIKGLFSQPNKQTKGLRPEQQTHIARLAADWNVKSAGSKQEARSNRLHLANSRSVFGFRQEYKELVYPLVANRVQGSKVWDVDGNEYVDITMGFGVSLFGHNPPFIKEALLAELEQGAAIGPASTLAGEVAQQIHQLTGVERCAFFSTGTEAIMCAVRLARAVTGRTRLVLFKGAYHGSFDGVLATGWINSQGRPEAIPMTDGTPEAMVEDLIVLDYGDMAGLDVIARYAEEIALVLVEPVQSRNPGNLPLDFLHALRQLTHERDVPLLFDEIISGFRFAPGGMQALLGIEADIVTYGKVLGHGQPFGVVSGKARFMDAVDGGQWSYGDESAPGVRTAFVAGTFNGHPLSLAAARAVLERIAADNGALQEELAAKTEAMCQRLDQLFAREKVPVRMERYGSLFRFGFGEETEILNTHLLNNGIFVWEQRNCFLSTAHSEEDIEKIISATQRGIAAMKRDGWFLADKDSASTENSSILPTTRSQTAMYHPALDPAALGLWTDMIALDLNGVVHRERLQGAIERVVDRHSALSTVLISETSQVYAKQARTGLVWLDFSTVADPEAQLRNWMEASLRRPFEPDLAPIRFVAAHLGAGRTTLIVYGHHLCIDGWSLALITRETLSAYQGIPLAEPDRLETYLQWEESAQPTAGTQTPVSMELPGSLCQSTGSSPAGSRITRTKLGQLRAALATRAQQGENTPFVLMLAAYAIFLSRLTNQRIITIGLPCAGQAAAGTHTLVGNLSFVRPVTLVLDSQERLDDFLHRLQRQVVAESSSLPTESLPQRHVLFNLDGPLHLAVEGLDIVVRPVPIVGARADLFVNLLSVNDQLVLDVDWPTEKFSRDQVTSWIDNFLVIAKRIAASDAGNTSVGEIAAAPQFSHESGSFSDWLRLPDPSSMQAPAPRKNRQAKSASLRTPSEQRLAKLWQSLLNMEVNSSEEDFFEAGGSSLAGVRLVAAIGESFGVVLRLADIFNAPHLSQMAALIDNREAGAESRIQAGERSTAPVSPQQRRLWLLEEMGETSAAYNITVALDFPWPLDPQALEQALAFLAARHDSLRAVIRVQDEVPVQMMAETIMPLLTIEDLKADTDWSARRAKRLEEVATTPIPLDRAPLWRVLLLQLPEGDCLALSIHHSISDVWSIEIVLRDLLDAYRAVRLGITPLQPDLALQYGDYCRWLATAAAPEQNKALAYWTRHLSGAPSLTTFPPDHPRPPVKTFAGARVHTLVVGEQLIDLRRLVKQQRSSLFQAVMAAVAVVAFQRTQQEELVLGTISASRNQGGLEDLVGLFANTLPIRFSLNAKTTLGDILHTTRDRLLAAAAHDLASLDEIIQALALPRSVDSNPLFEICVTHDDRRGIMRIAAEHGAVCEEVATPTTQFDFSLYVTETDDSLLLEATYATALYTQATAEAILEDIVTTLSRLITDPDQALVAAVKEPLPTPHQERLWFVDRFENGQLYTGAPVYYNMALIRRLEQPLDPEELQRRLDKLTQALPLLNRTMNMEGELPRFDKKQATRQAVQRAGQTLHLQPNLGGELASFIEHPFDLSRDLLLRAGIFQTESGERALVLVAHHIVLDFWSLNEIARLLLTDALPSLPAQAFDEFARHQRRPAAAWPKDLAYWRQQLAGELPRLLLPMDRPRPAIHTFTLGLVTAPLTTAEVDALQSWAEPRSLPLDDLLLAAFIALLQRLSRQDTIVLGTTAPYQPKEERSLIGPVTNLVTLKVACDTSVQLDAFVEQISQQSRESLRHGALPFDKVVLDLKPKNDMSRTALFDVLYVREEGGAEDFLLPPAIGWGKYDLTLASSRNSTGQRELALAFNLDILDEKTARHWLDILVVLLRGLPAASGQPLSDWALLSPENQQQLINAAQPRQQQEATSAPTSLPDAFAAQVAQMPDAIALVDGPRHLTYGEMELRANRIANRLLNVGVGQEDRVAILLARCLDWPVAMLGVLKAGAAFVPLDPQTAVERGQTIMATAGVKAMVVDDSVDRQLIQSDLPLLNLSSDDLETESSQPPRVPLHGHLLAYVLFTSGSTGTPKGVMVEHHNVLTLILGQGDVFHFGRDEVWSWFHSPAFDFSIWEIWGPLLTGGRLVVVPQSAQGDMAALRNLLHKKKVTLLNLTPSALYALLSYEEEQPHANLAVRSVWLGGEALTPSKLKGWAARYPTCRLLNLFGITETTVHVTFRELSPDDLQNGDSIIGRALPSYSVTIRDARLRLVPAGIAGEIVVGGSGVARGYLGQAQLSAERFVDDPLAPGKRVYRSGDLARTTLDGELVYLGRIDEQIKLRGFRIEPGEIENSLMHLPGVREAVVGTAVGADGKADKVVAWLVADPPPDPDEAANHLARTLPAYMIPAHVYLVESIPLTTNGKADRRLLATMCNATLGRNENSAAPKPGLEREIASIWCGLLDIAQVGRDDNFFELGGHSLKANQAVLRIRRNLGLELSLKDFFSAQSIAALAALLKNQKAATEQELPLAPPLNAYPLSSPQRRLFAMQHADPKAVAYNMVGGFILTGGLDPARLAQAFVRLRERHEILRTRFCFVDGQPAQMVDPPEQNFLLPLTQPPTGEREEATISRQLTAEFNHVFDLSQGHLLRAQLVGLEATPEGIARTLLVLNIHHIAADGWSVAVLMENLASFYDSTAPDLPPLRRQYKDFAYWQSQAFSEDKVHPALAFWRKRLLDAPLRTTIPSDFPRPQMRSGQGAMVRYMLSEEESTALRQVTGSAGTTLFAAFSALVHALLQIRSGSSATIIGTADAGRDMLEVEDQVGFYLNLIPFPMTGDPAASLSQWLMAAKEEAAVVLEQKAYPFDLLVEHLKITTAPGHSPIFDVLLLLQNNATPSGRFADLRIEPLADQTVSAKYDLNLMVEDRPAIELILEYDTTLFRRETAQWLLDDLVLLVEALAGGEDLSPVQVLQTDRHQPASETVGMLENDDPLLGMD